MTRIEIVVSPDGAAALETKGFSGDACRWASAFLESALGQKLTDQPTLEACAATESSALQQTS